VPKPIPFSLVTTPEEARAVLRESALGELRDTLKERSSGPPASASPEELLDFELFTQGIKDFIEYIENWK
jgi:hypothetical protein